MNCELLILADGTILAHNLTAAMAAVLAELAPADKRIQARAATDADRSADIPVRSDNRTPTRSDSPPYLHTHFAADPPSSDYGGAGRNFRAPAR
jgi:hypothetical protein